MWPFKHNKVPEDLKETLLSFERRISRMEEEWTDVYGKFRRLQMRTAKQVQRVEATEESQTAGTAETGGEITPISSLTERQRAIQAQIIARRNRGGVA